jgi:hypothetical protein
MAPGSPEKSPPDAASKIVTTTWSPTPIVTFGAPFPAPKVAARVSGPCEARSSAIV